MITNQGAYSTSKPMALYGLAEDDKPTETFNDVAIPNGSTYMEIDTGKVLMYDAENAEWHEI
ncbi:MAG: hypothetical protein IKN54_02390 [Lachnospiraceae bacterium]|nr:hypothetical protein [Lachnospiraceae bacterium]